MVAMSAQPLKVSVKLAKFASERKSSLAAQREGGHDQFLDGLDGRCVACACLVSQIAYLLRPRWVDVAAFNELASVRSPAA